MSLTANHVLRHPRKVLHWCYWGNKRKVFSVLLSLLLFCTGSILAGLFSIAHGFPVSDPFASNNTLYPKQKHLPKEFQGYRVSNYKYPTQMPSVNEWRDLIRNSIQGQLTTQNAPAYVDAVKRYLEAKNIDQLIINPMAWTPGTKAAPGWYDMPWGGQGSLSSDGSVDPTSGRESLLGSYTGQILLPNMYPSDKPHTKKDPVTKKPLPFQNHSVAYYNDVAAYQLGKIWKNPHRPDTSQLVFPEGSVIVKVEGVTLTEDEWPGVLTGSPVSYVYRPPVNSPPKTAPVVTPLRFLQLAVKIKDSKASPDTGWVFVAFTYDAKQPGVNAWKRTIPVGAMWGNDPQLAKSKTVTTYQQLKQTWVNEYWTKDKNGKPIQNFVTDSLGWGDRLAAPLDLSVRNKVIFVRSDSKDALEDEGIVATTKFKASSCISCHSTGQYPLTANLYPSPNMYFPPENGKFLLYRPGSDDWNLWFRNLTAKTAFSSIGDRSGIMSTDYDMMLAFALMRATGSPEVDTFIRNPIAGH